MKNKKKHDNENLSIENEIYVKKREKIKGWNKYKIKVG